jgi:hypothetical protein
MAAMMTNAIATTAIEIPTLAPSESPGVDFECDTVVDNTFSLVTVEDATIIAVEVVEVVEVVDMVEVAMIAFRTPML